MIPPATELTKMCIRDRKGTIVECNTAYGGERAGTEMHYQLAKDHGYTDIAEVDIMDKDGSMSLSLIHICVVKSVLTPLSIYLSSVVIPPSGVLMEQLKAVTVYSFS